MHFHHEDILGVRHTLCLNRLRYDKCSAKELKTKDCG